MGFSSYLHQKSGKIGLLQRTGNAQMESRPKNVVKTVACIAGSKLSDPDRTRTNGILA